jgi:hypothetical protein
MSPADFFAADYHDARARFLAACRDAGARVESHRCPAPGPDGQALHCDVAWLGPTGADRVLVTISATHGVEGFCGSGVQCGWLERGLADELPPGLGLLQIHGINPYGFAWLRRVNEDNVDLNRNFLDHAKPYPANPGYLALREAICPREWNDRVAAETLKVLDAYAEEHGSRAFQVAHSGGQYGDPQGIFFGGNRPVWSNQLLRRILAQHLARASHVAVIDYHTGLGPRGHGERICPHAPHSPALTRARAWYQDDVTCPAQGDSVSSEIHGHNGIGMAEALPEAALTVVALEFGTIPSPQVRLALRADNWLHVHGDPGSAQGQAIKRQIRDAFYGDDEAWKQAVWDRAVETQRLAITGLAES